MRYFSVSTVLVLLVLFLAACTNEGIVSHDPAPSEQLAATYTSNTLGQSNRAVTIPFKSDFFSNGVAVPDPDCGAFPPILKNIQDGFGEATHLGRFAFHVTFCQDITDLLDGELTEGESVPYWNAVGTMTAANGDELWITGSGAILPSDHPDYDFEFNDPFEFVGGTGRFEGASGDVVTHSFVDFASGQVDHDWSGTLTLLTGQ
ncbi:MAG TPA: hypothetical protein VKP65_14690 [Rhodothermales bacterium]|nr:hypothetical protein [Rhodothermales bacterium]